VLGLKIEPRPLSAHGTRVLKALSHMGSSMSKVISFKIHRPRPHTIALHGRETGQ